MQLMKKLFLLLFLIMTALNGYSYEVSFMKNSNKYFTIQYPYEILQNVFNHKIINPNKDIIFYKTADYSKHKSLFYNDASNSSNWFNSNENKNFYTYHKINMKYRSSFTMPAKYFNGITSGINFAFTGRFRYYVKNNVSINFSTDALMRMLQIMGGSFGRNDSIRVNAYVSYKF